MIHKVLYLFFVFLGLFTKRQTAQVLAFRGGRGGEI